MLILSLLVVLGLILLIAGGELFVKGSSSTAKKLNVSSLVIGLTIVSFGTSAPELFVNVFSSFQGASDLALGNILGSNISNIFLVLGVSAIIYPLKIKKGTVWKEIPFGVLSVLVLLILANDIFLDQANQNLISRADGLILLSFFLIFLYYTYGISKVEGESDGVSEYSWLKSISFIIIGIAGLTFGGKLIVDNGTQLARIAGLSDLFIGVTFTAVGTSLPELVTSAIAAYRRQVDLAVGNVVGSNIFNVLWVLGITPVISPMNISPSANTDILIATFAALLLFIAVLNGRDKFEFIKKREGVLSKTEGVLFILLYIGYIAFVSFRG